MSAPVQERRSAPGATARGGSLIVFFSKLSLALSSDFITTRRGPDSSFGVIPTSNV
jgi:hypothetical protein